MVPRGTRGTCVDPRDPRDLRRTRVGPRVMMACRVDPTTNFPQTLDPLPSSRTCVDPRGPAPHNWATSNAVWDPRSVKWNQNRGTRAGPAWPRTSDGLAAMQTIYTALESAKDLRRTRVNLRGCVTHDAIEQLPRTPNTGLPSRLYTLDPLSRFF